MSSRGRMGFRIVTDVERVEAALVERLRGSPSSAVADVMGRFRFMDPGIRPRTGVPLCGPAITVNARPGDNLMVHKALEVAEPGDVVVVSTNGNVTSAVFGELMCHAAVAVELEGLVVDGAIRDVEDLRALGFPAYSRAVCPGGCDKDGPGEINVPISCGSVAVLPGDLVVGDGDGVAVVPRTLAERVADGVEAKLEGEARRIEEIRGGTIFKPVVDQVLRDRGVLE